MNKSNRTKVVVTLLAMILISASLFAMGMKESDPAAVTVRILTTMNQNGQVTLLARSADNQDITFQAGSYTDASYPIASLVAGDYIEVVLDNNNKAMNIRYINPLVALGVLPYSISTERATELESLTDRFSYTYGYLLIQSFSAQGRTARRRWSAVAAPAPCCSLQRRRRARTARNPRPCTAGTRPARPPRTSATGRTGQT